MPARTSAGTSLDGRCGCTRPLPRRVRISPDHSPFLMSPGITPIKDDTDLGRESGEAANATALGRRALFGFLVTFIIARTMVLLIMARRIPNLYFFLQGTHVHHLNYGIFLLSGVGAYLLFGLPRGRALSVAALL